jgi:NADH dehydrogenase FAD-containing subunit
VGSACAKALDGHDSVVVTLVDSRAVMVQKVPSLRAVTQPGWVDAVLVPRDEVLKKGRSKGSKVVSALVASVDAAGKQVVLEDGSKLAYDFLVCATGAQSQSPGEPPASCRSAGDMKAHYAAVYAALGRARSVAIIGGGVVGVELAGEIAEARPDVSITIVHAGKKLLDQSAKPELWDSFHTKIGAQLKERKVTVLLGDRSNISRARFNGKSFIEGVGSFTTASGKTVTADLVFNCTGTTPNSGIYPREWLTERGLVKVDETLQVQGAPGCFACGDVVATDESKIYYTAVNNQVPVVAKNILALATGAAPAKTYKANTSVIMLVPLGNSGGCLVTPLGTLGAFMARNIKGKQLFYEAGWDISGVKKPKCPPLIVTKGVGAGPPSANNANTDAVAIK